LKPGEKEDGKFYTHSKGLVCLFLFHDPIINKVILMLTDKVVQCLETKELEGQMNEQEV
jgi:hypothetical protein